MVGYRAGETVPAWCSRGRDGRVRARTSPAVIGTATAAVSSSLLMQWASVPSGRWARDRASLEVLLGRVLAPEFAQHLRSNHLNVVGLGNGRESPLGDTQGRVCV